MKKLLHFAWGGWAVLAFAGVSGAQYTPPPPPLTTAPCVPTKKEPCLPAQAPAATTEKKPADEFPFPGDAPATAPADVSKEFPFPGETKAPDAPGASPALSPAQRDAAKQAAEEHPFPGDEGASSSSSSGSPSGDPTSKDKDDDGPTLKDLGSEGSTKFDRHKIEKVQDPADREDEDLTVSKFYQDRGNFRAAYLRAQDAVKVMPKDPDAHLRLAQTAEKMKFKDEAISEYTKYLSMDPKSDDAKAARTALADLK